jgi:DNA-binding response OmpR family regulator
MDSPHPQETGRTASRGRLLLVEDDPESAIFCTYVLQKRGGFDVTHVADPTVALTLAVTRPWDLVIADLDLPIMSGLEFVAALRRMAPRLPVVLVTAFPHLAPPLVATKVGRQPDALLAKPVPADLLLSTATALAVPAA